MLAIVLGCGLRRFEVAALTLGPTRQRDNRWLTIDFAGNNGARTIPMAMWVKAQSMLGTSGAGSSEGTVLRRASRGDQVQVSSEKVF